MRRLGVCSLLLAGLGGTAALAGRPVYSEFAVSAVAAQAAAIVHGQLVAEERRSACELAWRVRALDVVRADKTLPPGLRPVAGAQILLGNRGTAGHADCEIRSGDPGGSGASFPAQRMRGGADGWQAFLDKKPVFLLLAADGADRFRLVMDASVTVERSLLPPAERATAVADAWFAAACAPNDGPATHFTLALADGTRIHLIVYAAEPRVRGAYAIGDAHAQRAHGRRCDAGDRRCAAVNGQFAVRAGDSATLLLDLALGQPDGFRFAAKDLRFRRLATRALCG